MKKGFIVPLLSLGGISVVSWSLVHFDVHFHLASQPNPQSNTYQQINPAPVTSPIREVPKTEPRRELHAQDEPREKAQPKQLLSRWMESDEYQDEVYRQIDKKVYPRRVEGRNQNGIVQFRALFVPYPSEAFAFDSRHLMDEQYYLNHGNELVAQGYVRIYSNHFTDTTGVIKYQATWVRNW